MEMLLKICHSSFTTVRFLPSVPFHRLSSTLPVNILDDNKEQETYIPREKSALDVYSDDLSDLTPHFPRTFNVAAYVNKSDTLQKLLSLNVNISEIEKKPHIFDKFLRLDFEKDMKKHILFLSDYVQEEYFAKFLTKNPMIFYEDIEDLQVRINYLLSKRFKNHEIQNIISRNPFWLMFSTNRIDTRLGFFQKNFDLIGNEVRALAVKDPKLITYNMHSIQTNNFSIKLEMGFSKKEVKSLILNTPKMWKMNHMSLLRKFNYIHNVMKIPHETICQFSRILLCREFRIKQRHMFLEKLGRAQFDPKKENYVPIVGLVEGTDLDFCKNFAKCTVDDFNLYLKTL